MVTQRHVTGTPDPVLTTSEARRLFPTARLKRGDGHYRVAEYVLRPCPITDGAMHLWTERRNVMGAYRWTQVGQCAGCVDRERRANAERNRERVARWRDRHPVENRERGRAYEAAHRARKRADKAKEAPTGTH